MDYNDSQESGESFRTQMEKATGNKIILPGEKEGEQNPRRCNRFKAKEDAKIEDLAKERAAAKDDYGNSDDNLNVLNQSNITLSDMAHLVGIDLGCSLDMVETNLEIMRKLEKVRYDLMIQASKNNNETANEQSSPVRIDTGDAAIEELCLDGDNSDLDIEEACFEKLKQVFSTKKTWNNNSPISSCAKIVVSGRKKGKIKRFK